MIPGRAVEHRLQPVVVGVDVPFDHLSDQRFERSHQCLGLAKNDGRQGGSAVGAGDDLTGDVEGQRAPGRLDTNLAVRFVLDHLEGRNDRAAHEAGGLIVGGPDSQGRFACPGAALHALLPGRVVGPVGPVGEHLFRRLVDISSDPDLDHVDLPAATAIIEAQRPSSRLNQDPDEVSLASATPQLHR